MNGAEDRMQEICIQEIAGVAVMPDVRGVVRARVRRRRRNSSIFAIAAGVLLSASLLILFVGRPAIRDAELRGSVADLLTPEASAGADADKLSDLRDRQWRAYVATLDRLTAHPNLWEELVVAASNRLTPDLPRDVRSRVVALLAHAPDPKVDLTLLRELETHAEELDAETLLLLEAREIDGASQALNTLRPRDRRGEILVALWRVANGDLRPMATLMPILSSETELIVHSDLYFATAITVYRARRYRVWNTCWSVTNGLVQRLLVSGDVQQAFETTIEMAWFYPFLTVADSLPLDDVRLRAHRYVRSYERTKSQREEIADWLARMK